MTTAAVRTRRVPLGDNLWKEVPVLAMDAREHAEEDLEEGMDARDHEAALREAMDAYNRARDRRRRLRARDGRHARDLDPESRETDPESEDRDGRRGRDALADRRDHREDFRPGDRDHAHQLSLHRAHDGIAHDSAGACDLSSLFPTLGNGHPYANRRDE